MAWIVSHQIITEAVTPMKSNILFHPDPIQGLHVNVKPSDGAYKLHCCIGRATLMFISVLCKPLESWYSDDVDKITTTVYSLKAVL